MGFSLIKRENSTKSSAAEKKSLNDSNRTIDTATSSEIMKEKSKGGDNGDYRNPLERRKSANKKKIANSLEALMHSSSSSLLKPSRSKSPSSGRPKLSRRKSADGLLMTTDTSLSKSEHKSRLRAGSKGLSVTEHKAKPRPKAQGLSMTEHKKGPRARLKKQNSESNLRAAAARAKEKKKEKEASASGAYPPSYPPSYPPVAMTPPAPGSKKVTPQLKRRPSTGTLNKTKKRSQSSAARTGTSAGMSEIEILQEKIRRAKAAKNEQVRRAPTRSKSSDGLGLSGHGLSHAVARTEQQQRSNTREKRLEEKLQEEQEKADELSTSLAEMQKVIANLKDEKERVNHKLRQEQRDAERAISEKDKEINELSDTVDRILDAERKVDSMGGNNAVRLEYELKEAKTKADTLEKVVEETKEENTRLATELSCYKDSQKSGSMHIVDTSIVKENADLKDKLKFKDETIEHLMKQLEKLKRKDKSIDGKAPADMDRSGHGLVSSIANRMNREKEAVESTGRTFSNSFVDTINRFSPGTLSRRNIPRRADRVKQMAAPTL